MKKLNSTSKAKLSPQELHEELTAIAKELRTSTVSFTRARLSTLIERLDSETASEPKKRSKAASPNVKPTRAKPSKTKPRKKKTKS